MDTFGRTESLNKEMTKLNYVVVFAVLIYTVNSNNTDDNIKKLINSPYNLDQSQYNWYFVYIFSNIIYL